MADSGSLSRPHIALFPNAGVGHLTPFLRLAALLIDQRCHVTLITVHPSISNAESRLVDHFLSAYPQVNGKRLHLLPFDPSTANSTDPFFLRWEATRRSISLLHPLLSSISPISAIVYDVTLTSPIIPILTQLSLPGYVLFTASARMLAFVASIFSNNENKLISSSGQVLKPTDLLEIPGLPPVTVSMIPQVLLNPKHIFTEIFRQDCPNLVKSSGILLNTLEKLEPETLHALNVSTTLPPVHAVGPLLPLGFEKSCQTRTFYNNNIDDDVTIISWLNDQGPESVVFVCFGSRTPMSRDQIREIAVGLASCGHKFLWVVKLKTIDREDDDDLDEVLGIELVKRIKESGGLVVKNWVHQNELLAHDSVGGFLSHGGWNSMIEAVVNGVRILVWPQLGDQAISGQVLETAGIGLWDRSWGWGMQNLVRGQEIAHKVKEMMDSELLRQAAKLLKEEAKKAAMESRTLKELVKRWS
ncbi:UDP-glycosyltransferase 708G1-like [Rutidosis leptorrhynchoides]|uniref:UDP-glycosyltransferase 708G1-like n=1 Tax=Rutidosis leptorrhynchoides TaxID=125765 RepID=UPI003A98EE94